MAQIQRTVARAEAALGDVEKASRWLSQPHRELGGQRPLDLLHTDEGTRAVEEVLGRAERGGAERGD